MSPTKVAPYANSWEHLSAELGFVELVVRNEVETFKRIASNQPEILRGMFISDAEIADVLDRIGGRVQPVDSEWGRVAKSLRAEIDGRRRASIDQGVYLSLPRLANIFGLTALEEQVIAVCLAPEIDQRYERLYAYLQDDVSRTQPGVDLVLRLVCATEHERVVARSSFSAGAPLIRAQILRHQEGDSRSLLSRGLRLDEQIVNHLMGGESVSRDIAACSRPLSASPDALRDLRWPQTLKERLVAIIREQVATAVSTPRRLIYHFYGPAGTGKKTLAAALCGELGISLLAVDLREIVNRGEDFDESLARLLREALMRPAAIYLEHLDELPGEEARVQSQKRSIARAIGDLSWLTFIGTQKNWEPGGLFGDHVFLSVELRAPNLGERIELWPSIASGLGAPVAEVDWAEVAARFRLTPGQMRDSIVAARNHSLLRSPGEAGKEEPIGIADLYAGCKRQSNQKLGELARRLPCSRDWNDITLPAHSIAQLREICDQVRHRPTVYGCWGFSNKQSGGKGLCVLFHGLSGTGKTLAAEVIGSELRLEVFKIDLSTVVSKYIGETEKNLSKVFEEAETSNGILFFDEADALFGKRSEVKDAHDRYANIEINYLLQRVEEFEGLVILATNLRKNIDEAFFRRMHFAVEFPLPDEPNRYRIWKQHLPDAAPVDGDVDFGFLARRLNITGGNIRNVVVNAAFLAAANSGVIHMEHFIRAAKREYEKIGRFCTDADFAPYQAWLKEA